MILQWKIWRTWRNVCFISFKLGRWRNRWRPSSGFICKSNRNRGIPDVQLAAMADVRLGRLFCRLKFSLQTESSVDWRMVCVSQLLVTIFEFWRSFRAHSQGACFCLSVCTEIKRCMLALDYFDGSDRGHVGLCLNALSLCKRCN